MLKGGYQVKTDLDRKLLLGVWPQSQPGEENTDSQSADSKNSPRNSNRPASAFKDSLRASNSLLMSDMEMSIAPKSGSRLIGEVSNQSQQEILGNETPNPGTVSYTHLTLPTICSV